MIRIPSTVFLLALALAVHSLVLPKSYGLEVYADGTIAIGAEEGKVEGDVFAVTCSR